MKQKLSKREIWRNTSSAFVRGMFGFRVFCMYLGLVITLFFIPKFSMLIDNCIDVLQNRISKNDYKVFEGFSLEQISIFVEAYKSIFVALTVFGLLLGIGITIWYNIGKSRCLTTVIFVKDVMACMFYIYLMCRFPIFNSLIVLWFIFILFFTFVDFLIMKSIYAYRKKLAEAIFQYNEGNQKSTGNGRYMPEYQINKPKLDLSYHSVDDKKGPMLQKIPIDEYVKDNTKKGKSVYQDVNLDKQETEEKSTLTEITTHDYEQDDGVKVDTSLGYRRITFEDL